MRQTTLRRGVYDGDMQQYPKTMITTKRWSVLAIAVIAGVVLFSGDVSGQGKSQGKSKGGGSATATSASITVVFRDSDRVTFRDYFVTHKIAPQSLPPGIAKNVARGKPLPPGIAKRAVPADLLVLGPRVDKDVSFSIVGEVVVALKGGVVIDVMGGIFGK
jgi:hypothetical protein